MKWVEEDFKRIRQNYTESFGTGSFRAFVPHDITQKYGLQPSWLTIRLSFPALNDGRDSCPAAVLDKKAVGKTPYPMKQ